MVDDRSLARIIQDLIGRRSEGVYWDFKLRHQARKGELIHDVLCFANAEHDGPRFLVFGVRDGDFSVCPIDASEGRRTQAEIADLFRGNADKFFQSRFPMFQLREIEIDGEPIDVLVIEDEPKKPYYLVQQIESFDDNKKGMVAPDWRALGRGRLYYYAADSVDYAVQEFWTAREGQDDSRGLRIRGDGEAAREARSRWPSGIDIPVLEPGELDAFLETRPRRAVNAPDPATDPAEQYELFLRILMDFDDWRRAQGRSGRRRVHGDRRRHRGDGCGRRHQPYSGGRDQALGIARHQPRSLHASPALVGGSRDGAHGGFEGKTLVIDLPRSDCRIIDAASILGIDDVVFVCPLCQHH